MIWQIHSCKLGDVDKFLAKGWEPFTVTTDVFNGERIWLRRRIQL